jgi:hypothetical protein
VVMEEGVHRLTPGKADPDNQYVTEIDFAQR